MPPLPTELARPLYEIIPEVKVSAASASSEIYAPSHSYALPTSSKGAAEGAAGIVNISKNIDISKPATSTGAASEKDQTKDKEDEKKQKDKKDKYKVKF